MLSKSDPPSQNFVPKYLSAVTSWHGHLHFAYDLIEKLRPNLFVELGVHYGDSYFTFCQSVKDHNVDCNCYAVDCWLGEKHSGIYGEEVWETVNKYNQEHYANFSKLIRSSFSNAVSEFKDSSIDILHIDGFHTYEAVKEDFSTWLPKISEGGIVLMHDICVRNDDFGVWKLWNEIEEKFNCFSFKHCNGLGILSNCSEKLSRKLFFQSLKTPFADSYYKASSKLISSMRKISSMEYVYSSIEQSNQDLTRELSEKNLKVDDLESKLAHLEDELSRFIDKNRRMQTSFSWIITSPLRFFRRTFIDPFLKEQVVFNPKLYLDLNPDLKRVFGDDYESARNHYITFGKKENRPYSKKTISPSLSYENWVVQFDSNNQFRIEQYIRDCKLINYKPLISIICPVFNVKPKLFLETINSVKSQIYQEWELIIVDDCSDREELIDTIKSVENSDDRIKLITKKKNGHISEASNSGLSIASGNFVVFLDHDDLLREHSLLSIVRVINDNPDCKFIYTDEDKIDKFGNRKDPFFKPDWNPDLLLSQNYICHLCCISLDIVRHVNGFRKGFEGCQDWDLFLRVTECLKENEIIHIPEILYHWRIIRGSTAYNASEKNYVFENSIKTVESAMSRTGKNTVVETISRNNNYIRVRYRLATKKPKVSIIIPTRDYLELLKVCVDGIMQSTSYSNYEILILDNDSKKKDTIRYLKNLSKDDRVSIIKIPGEFNYSKINNQGVLHTNGELLLFLNNDVEPINEDWLSEMVSHAARPEIGCVGAKLLYPNDKIQHAGVILGLGGLAGHAFKGFPSTHHGYKHRLNLVQNYSAVTAACLMVKRNLFEMVGGFNEKELKVAFNDVDLCLKIKEKGYRNLWTPFAQLYHYESASRGDDFSPKKKKRFKTEANYIKKKWEKIISHDPAYNSNLNIDREDFSLGQPRGK